LNINGGTVTGWDDRIGNQSGSVGTATVSSGTWNNAGSLYVGYGNGTLNLTGSGVVTIANGTGILNLAAGAGSSGILNIGMGGTAGTLNTAAVTGNSGTATVNFNHTGSYTFAPQLQGALSVNKLGSGTTILNASNSYTGPTTVNAGTLTLDYSTQNNNKLSDTAALILAGGTLNLTGGGNHTEIVSGTTLNAGASAVTRGTGTEVIIMGMITRYEGATVDFSAPGVAYTFTNNVNGILGAWATVGGTDWAKDPFAITPYTAYTDIAARGSSITSSAATNVRINSAGSGGNIALASGTTDINTLLQNTTTAATIDTAGKTLRLGARGGILLTPGNQALTIGPAPNLGTFTAGGAPNAAGELILTNNSSNTLTVNAVVANNGSGVVNLTKSGTGTLALAGINTYTGQTYLNGGTTKIISNANLGLVFTGATLNFNGGTLALASATFVALDNGGGAAKRLVVLGLNGGTFDVANGGTLLVSGMISGAGNLTKANTGMLVLTGSNSYTGGTTITGGTLLVVNPNALGASSNPLAVNGGTLDLNGYNVAVGTLSGSSGALISGGTGITVNQSSNATYAGTIQNGSGTPALTKDGPATLTLTGNNNYTGGTTIKTGMLTVTSSGSINHGGADMTVGNLSGDNGSLHISGGTVTDAHSWLGYNTGSTGTATVTSGTWNSSFLTVGYSGTGILNINGGTVTDDFGELAIYSAGTATVTSGTWNNSGDLYIGKAGTGTLNVNGGTVTDSSGYLGYGSVGTATVSSGIWSNSSNLYVGFGSGTLNLTNSGVVTIASGTGTMTLGYTAGSSGTLNIGTGGTAGTLNAAVVTCSSGTATVNFNHTGIYTFAPKLSGNLVVNKLASGTTILSASNTYTGDTTVTAGTLSLTNPGLANTSAVNLSTGGVLNLNFAGSNTISTLRINGVAKLPGTWGGIASSATYRTALITGPGILNVTNGPAQPPPIYWTGAVSSEWNNPGNWDLGYVPTGSEVVQITGGNVSLSSGTVSGSIVLGTMNGTMTVAPGAVLNICGGNTNLGGSINNSGTINWTGGSLKMYGGSQINNLTQGLFDVQNDQYIVWGGGDPMPVFTNAGTFRKSAGSGMSGISGVAFTNTGTIDVQTGILDLFNGFNSTGIIGTSGSGSVWLNLGGTSTISGTLTGKGLQLRDGTITGKVYLAGTLNWFGGTMNGAMTVAPGGMLNISGSNTNLGGSIDNSGTITMTSGGLSLVMYGGSKINNMAQGLFDVQNDQYIVWSSGGGGGPMPVFDNAGTFRKSAGSGMSGIIGVAFTNTGTINVQTGMLILETPGLANSSTVNLGTGGVLGLFFSDTNTISTFQINGVAQSPGMWGGVTSSVTYRTALITGPGLLNVTNGPAQQPYASWAAEYNLDNTPGPQNGFSDDPDRDGIPNGLEWILGGNPLSGSTAQLPQVTADANNFMFTFRRNVASESTATLVVEWGSDLIGWFDVPIGAASSGPDANGVTVTITANGDDPDTVVVAIPRSNAVSGKLFVRLKATLP
jgi:autotransporter-associated beta strand protein/T5SS/PEP-CTERM-associated repeat protein